MIRPAAANGAQPGGARGGAAHAVVSRRGTSACFGPAFCRAVWLVWQCKRRAWPGDRPAVGTTTAGPSQSERRGDGRAASRSAKLAQVRAARGVCGCYFGASLAARTSVLHSSACTHHSIPTSSTAPLSRPRGRRGRRLRPLESTEEYKRRLGAVCRCDMMQCVSGVTMVRRVGDLELCLHGASEFAIPIQGRSGTQSEFVPGSPSTHAADTFPPFPFVPLCQGRIRCRVKAFTPRHAHL